MNKLDLLIESIIKENSVNERDIIKAYLELDDDSKLSKDDNGGSGYSIGPHQYLQVLTPQQLKEMIEESINDGVYEGYAESEDDDMMVAIFDSNDNIISIDDIANADRVEMIGMDEDWQSYQYNGQLYFIGKGEG